MTKTKNNTVSIFQAIDDICNQRTNMITTNSISSSIHNSLLTVPGPEMGRVPDGGTSYPPPSQGDQIQTPRVPYGGSYPPPSLSDQIKTPWVGGGNIWESVNIPIFETSDVVGYPKANGYVLPNGDTIIEIAITGFDKEELKINREDQVLVVKAHKENKIDAENDGRKYLYHQIAERNFDYKVSCSNKQDLDKIEATVNNGKLIIKIPLKEYTYPTKKEIQIL